MQCLIAKSLQSTAVLLIIDYKITKPALSYFSRNLTLIKLILVVDRFTSATISAVSDSAEYSFAEVKVSSGIWNQMTSEIVFFQQNIIGSYFT